MPSVLLFGNYADLVNEIGAKAAEIVAERLRLELSPLNTNTEILMAKIDSLVIATQNVSDKATEHRAVVDEAIALIKSIGVEDPRLDAVLAQLDSTAAQLDTATTDLAAADDAPAEPPVEEPVDPEVPVDPETPADPEVP